MLVFRTFSKSNIKVWENSLVKMYLWLSREKKSRVICVVRYHPVIYMIRSGMHQRIYVFLLKFL